MEYKEWMKYITPDDMPNDDLKHFAELIGVDPVIELIFNYPGVIVSIPKYSFKEAKTKYIINEFDGTTHKTNKLAVECGICQRQVYNIIENYLYNKNTSANKINDNTSKTK